MIHRCQRINSLQRESNQINNEDIASLKWYQETRVMTSSNDRSHFNDRYDHLKGDELYV